MINLFSTPSSVLNKKNKKVTLLAQIISQSNRSKFAKIVTKKQSNKHAKGHNSWTHLVGMLFCHFAKSQSVHDINNELMSATDNLTSTIQVNN